MDLDVDSWNNSKDRIMFIATEKETSKFLMGDNLSRRLSTALWTFVSKDAY